MPEEKKENGFTKFFHKVGKNISDANRESKLESAYTKDARKFSIYEDDSAFGGISKYGKILDETHVELYGELKDNDIPLAPF